MSVDMIDRYQRFPQAHANALAAVTPIRSAGVSPGQLATATASRSSPVIAASLSVSRRIGRMFSICARAAISGTTPPYFRCRSTCVATWLAITSRPSATTAAAVSSQLLSIPRILILFVAKIQPVGWGSPPRVDCSTFSDTSLLINYSLLCPAVASWAARGEGLCIACRLAPVGCPISTSDPVAPASVRHLADRAALLPLHRVSPPPW